MSVSPVAPGKSVAKVQPSASMSGWTTETEMCGSSPLRARTIIVRCAQGQAWLT
jgi:hypothetical protein